MMIKMTGESKNILEQNIADLRKLFPEVCCEDKIDFDKLKQILGEYVDDNKERYNFTWNGKGQAIKLSQTPSMGTLRPYPGEEESKNWDTTENLYIEGDNLEVLKLLQKSYYGKVKMIYIDPPYNTGRDFIYPDDYRDSISNYQKLTGQLSEEGHKTSSNSETSGRYHTEWLNMMLARLRVARTLLTDEGLMFISVDDNEVENLKKICNEIFGESNFIGCAGRITKKSNNKGDFWAPNFDYLLTYAKNKEHLPPFLGEANTEAYNLVDDEGPRAGEKYQLVRLYMSSLQNRNPEQRFWIECPDGSKVIPPGKTFPPERPLLGDGIWRWSKSTCIENKDKIVIKKVSSSNLLDEDGNPAKWNVFTKTYLNDVIEKASAKPNSFIEGCINQIASHELNALQIPFDYAKPTPLLMYLMKICRVSKTDIVLDFFSGSATTAHAVMQLNAEDGGNRRFIMVQLPEPCAEKTEAYKAGYRNICEIGKERIRRAGEKIKQEVEAENAQLKMGEEPKKVPDIGFKVFKLDSSNLKKWQPDYDDFNQSLLDSIDNYVDGRTELDVVYEIMLKMGLELTYPLEACTVKDKNIYVIAYGALMICLDHEITTDVAHEMIRLHEEYQPEIWQVVFKDNGFASDSVKTNIKEMLKVAGLDEDAFTTI